MNPYWYLQQRIGGQPGAGRPLDPAAGLRGDDIPAFRETAAGEGTDSSTSFGSSGDQKRAVEAGQPADFVYLALEPDLTDLVEAGLVAESWDANPHDGSAEAAAFLQP